MSCPISLGQFVARVEADCNCAIAQAPFCADQHALLSSALQRFFSASRPDDWGQPLGLYYAIYRVCGSRHDQLARVLARFLVFYIASADLFDDVQDDDLAGKPHAERSPAIATNSALTLLVLALDALGEAAEMEKRADRKLSYMRLFNRVSKIAVGAQHQDLLGHLGATSTAEVEEMHRGKTSSVALLTECAALVGGAPSEVARLFFGLGQDLAAMVQVIDDVRDLVAKDVSADLAGGKSTYPLACFYETADEPLRQELGLLLSSSAVDLEAVRELLAESGAFDSCAVAVERHRQRIVDALAAVVEACGAAAPGPHHRLIEDMVSSLVSALYDVEPRQATSPAAGAGFDRQVERHAQKFASIVGQSRGVETPPLLPWHLPTYLYVPSDRRIYYCDLDGLPEEILPFHAALLGRSEADADVCMRKTMPFLIAHEMVHALRDQWGLLSGDAWHEEHVANELAFAYVRSYEPDVAAAVVESARRIVEVHGPSSDARLAKIVERASRGRDKEHDYECTVEEGALVHALMIVRFASGSRRLEVALDEWLPNAPEMAAE